MGHGLAFLEGPLLLPRTIRSTSHGGATTTGFDHEPSVSYFLEQALDCSEEEVVGEIGEALSVAASGGVEGGKGGDGDADGKGRRQGLGLGRKRARFSMMPSKSSRESSDVNLSSKVDRIVDPDEYFAALERNDFAEKELKKLRGDVAADLTKDNVFRSKRQRRPGLLQRRTSLKHFSQELADYGKTLLLSQEVNASKSSSPLKSATHKKCNSHADYNSLSSISQVMETVGSQLSDANEQEGFVADKENRADNIIDKLLSSYEVLHDQEGVALLQECLQFKTMVVDKIQLPVTPPDTPPDTQAATSVRRNPLAAISFLQKQTLRSGTLTDPYRWLSDDAPCAGEPSALARNGVAVACPDRTDTAQLSSPAISMNDTCTPCRKSGSKLNLEEILKSPSTLGLSINNNFTPPGKRGSNLSFSGTLESSNTEGGGEIFLDECPTDTFPSSIVKTAEDKKHLSVVANTQTLTSLSSNALVANPLSQKQILLADALAQSSESPTDDASCASEPTPATKNEITYANSHHDNITQPTIPVTSMNDTPAPSRKNRSKTGSEVILRSPSTLALSVNDPSTPRGSKLSFGRILKSPTIEERNNSCGKISLDECASSTSHRSIDKSAKKVSRRFDRDSGAGFIGFQSPSKEKGDDTWLEAATQKKPGTSLERLYSETLNPVETDGLAGTFSGCVVGDVDANPQDVDEALHEEHELTDLEDQSRSALGTTAIAGGHPESSGILGEQHDEENQTTSRVPNGMAPHQSKRRKSRGKSLAGDGTRLVAGVRRSTRERFRPLEHWRGERLLYGRIHQSLATVIGVKYSSPGGNKLKVKSFVSQEYTELVERAALH